MIDFSEEESLFQQKVRRFALERLAPQSRRWDSGEELPRSFIEEFAKQDLMGLRVPEAHGGSDAPFSFLGIAAEEIGRGDSSFGSLVTVPGLLSAILHGATPSLQERWYPALASGKAVPSYAVTEPEVGTDAANLRTRAERDGDSWVISGEKSSISFAGLADIAVVFARTGGSGARGVSCFLVPLNISGVSREVYSSPGDRVTKRGSLRFDNVRVPLDHLVGQPGEGFVQAISTLDYNRAVLSLCQLGAAQQSLDETVTYVRTRRAFGSPLAKFEGVSFQIVEDFTRIETARLLCYQVLRRKDRGLPHAREAAMAKLVSMRAAFEVIHHCLLLHGHYGYNTNLPFELRLRNVMGMEIGAGTDEALKLTLARDIIGKEAIPYR